MQVWSSINNIRPPSSAGMGSRLEKPSDTEGNKSEDEKIALRELGISQSEANTITGNIKMFSDQEFIAMIGRVFNISDDKSKVKRAYYKCVKEWHPDVSDEKYKNINEMKLKIANSLYQEYNRRFK